MGVEMGLVVVAVVHEECGVAIPVPLAGEAGAEALGEHEDVVSAVGAVPVRVVLDDDIHSVSEKLTRACNVVR